MAGFDDLPNEIQERILSFALQILPRTTVYVPAETTKLVVWRKHAITARFDGALDMLLVNKHFAKLMIRVIGEYMTHERAKVALEMKLFPLAYIGALHGVKRLLYGMRYAERHHIRELRYDIVPPGLSPQLYWEAVKEYMWGKNSLRNASRRRQQMWSQVLELEVHFAPLFNYLTEMFTSIDTSAMTWKTAPSAGLGTPLYPTPWDASYWVDQEEFGVAYTGLGGRWERFINDRLLDASDYEIALSSPKRGGRDEFDSDEEEDFWGVGDDEEPDGDDSDDDLSDDY